MPERLPGQPAPRLGLAPNPNLNPAAGGANAACCALLEGASAQALPLLPPPAGSPPTFVVSPPAPPESSTSPPGPSPAPRQRRPAAALSQPAAWLALRRPARPVLLPPNFARLAPTPLSFAASLHRLWRPVSQRPPVCPLYYSHPPPSLLHPNPRPQRHVLWYGAPLLLLPRLLPSPLGHFQLAYLPAAPVCQGGAQVRKQILITPGCVAPQVGEHSHLHCSVITCVRPPVGHPHTQKSPVAVDFLRAPLSPGDIAKQERFLPSMADGGSVFFLEVAAPHRHILPPPAWLLGVHHGCVH